MSYQNLSVQQTRNNLAEVIERVALAGEKFIITKFGKAKAMIVPLQDEKQILYPNKVLEETLLVLRDITDPIWQLPKISKNKKKNAKFIGSKSKLELSKDDQLIYISDPEF